ncbi:MAG TPA: hypothetical protein VHD36_08470 [Pirellulales bacterium]|nr:hypothetical protein [Pirellulales bacterium]
MSEPLQEFISSRGVTLRVDREAGIIRGVKILGTESQNGRTYLPEALAAAASLYEGAKVNVNHPKSSPGSPRDYQDRIGAIHGVTVRTTEGLFADLHFNPAHALAGQLAWDAEHAPENVGFSHNVLAKTARRNGRVVVESITKVQSVDLVADPATTRGLFESTFPVGRAEGAITGSIESVVWEELTPTDIRSRRPDLIDLLAGELARENAQLRAQVDNQRASDAASGRRRLAERLLAEANLPDPRSESGWAREIVSEAFFSSLLAAPDEDAMRRLVQERARLVAAAAGLPARRSTFAARTLARDQQMVESSYADKIDVDAFVKAITR